MASADAQDCEVATAMLRYFYKGQKCSRGKLLPVTYSVANPRIPGSELRRLLHEAGVDLQRFDPLWFNKKYEGFVPVDHGIFVPEAGQLTVDVILEERATFSAFAAQRLLATNRVVEDGAPWPDCEGYFGIGIVRGKTEFNHGTLWRSAYQMGAAFTYTIGAKYCKRTDKIADTTFATQRIPAWQFEDFSSFATTLPFGAPLVAIEMGGQPLETFRHPLCCVYVLGAEDNGLASSVLEMCHHVVSLPSVRMTSYNVAVAGSIVMYDRMVKMSRGEEGIDRSFLKDAGRPKEEEFGDEEGVEEANAAGNTAKKAKRSAPTTGRIESDGQQTAPI
eukprot:TRINITY_DN81376_c0_g1_i1.p1 TRINITY_DN81376_c0_g1~~TRINITY_DN81376_c0_g1_i1.p1  ORF type:complete len:340 (-),score=40.58 TRINITY_DN81376_c0_g1_i1:2-1000(-)